MARVQKFEKREKVQEQDKLVGFASVTDIAAIRYANKRGEVSEHLCLVVGDSVIAFKEAAFEPLTPEAKKQFLQRLSVEKSGGLSSKKIDVLPVKKKRKEEVRGEEDAL